MKGEPDFLWLKLPQQRSLRVALLVAAAGLALLLLLSGAPRPRPPGAAAAGGTAEAAAGVEGDALARLEADLAARLERILGDVRGAGRVRVQVALAGGVEREFALDRTLNRTVTEEQDREGGARRVTQVDEQGRVVAVTGGGGQELLVRRLRGPEVRGVLVVAEGAGDPVVRDALARAAQAALGVPLHLVTVVPGTAGEGGEAR